MVTVNIHEAKTQLSKLVDQAVKGEAFVIAKAGKPLVKVAALDAPPEPQRLGFLAGEIAVPEDFNRMGEAEIAAEPPNGSASPTQLAAPHLASLPIALLVGRKPRPTLLGEPVALEPARRFVRGGPLDQTGRERGRQVGIVKMLSLR